jgi:DNA-binding MarR family transcriptional regulator
MKKDLLEKATANFHSIPPFIHRILRQKIVKTTSGDLFDKNITSIHTEIILFLDEEGPLSIGEIGDHLMIAKAQMTQLIGKLVEQDIVERRDVKGDRRKIEIAITANGKKFLKEHKKNIDKWFIDAMSDISDKDLNSLTEALKTVKNILYKLINPVT